LPAAIDAAAGFEEEIACARLAGNIEAELAVAETESAAAEMSTHRFKPPDTAAAVSRAFHLAACSAYMNNN
jgi:hypothetical protein